MAVVAIMVLLRSF